MLALPWGLCPRSFALFVCILSEDDLNCFHGVEYHLSAGDSQISILALHSELDICINLLTLHHYLNVF